MSIYFYDIIQGTDEWFDIKRGKFGASSAAELLMTPGTAGYQKLINKIVFERITGKTAESYSNGWMERGLELEPEAIQHYELSTFNKVKRVGYASCNEWVGCSPDGLIGEDGLIQIKCPAWNTQLEYYFSDKVPSNYYKQCQFEMFVTVKGWNIFYSYYPGLKPFICKIERDEEMIKQIVVKLDESIQLVKQRIAKLTE